MESATDITAPEILELLYQGANCEAAVEKARDEAYLRGRNEAVELEQARRHAMPADDGGGITQEEEPDLPLLQYIRRSVWDD